MFALFCVFGEIVVCGFCLYCVLAWFRDCCVVVVFSFVCFTYVCWCGLDCFTCCFRCRFILVEISVFILSFSLCLNEL